MICSRCSRSASGRERELCLPERLRNCEPRHLLDRDSLRWRRSRHYVIETVYFHVRRGGSLSLESFQQTARELMGRARARGTQLKNNVEKKVMHEVASTVVEATASD